MSLAVVHSRALVGLHAPPVTVEVHLANGLPSFTLVGLADTEVKEARERVRAALLHSGLGFPHNKRITVNLAPAELPKEGGRYDLAIALGILAANEQLPATALEAFEFTGELSLSGDLRPVPGALALAVACRSGASGRSLVMPGPCADEAALVPGCHPFAADHLLDVVAALQPTDPPALRVASSGGVAPAARAYSGDMRDVRGQSVAKRALEVAAAGGHSVLLVGPPGSGKSMLAQRFNDLLPPMGEQESLQSAAVLSLAGRFDASRWARRPFRSPHHSASAVALVGGGSPPRPGEISLAHHGTLFLDELPEFPRQALEALREPLETGHITISRAARQAEFPAAFQLIAAMNPCPCGFLGDPQRTCRCTPEAVRRYQGKLSGPLLDRIDVRVEVVSIPPRELVTGAQGESTQLIAERVQAARERQVQRQGGPNAKLDATELARHIAATDAARTFLEKAAERLGWSNRSFFRALRVARSIADLTGSSTVEAAHVAEAVQLRRALPGQG